MYYSSDDEVTYRDYMIKIAMANEDLEKWHDGLLKATTVDIVNLKYMETDLVVS
jgi:hypothetical protein